MKLFNYSFACLMLLGCGSVTDPKDVEVTKLKPALDLQVLPGETTITLSWLANNSESDFSGFNIYLSDAKTSDIIADFDLKKDDVDPHRYSPIVFKDAAEEEIASVRPNLAKYFNWDIKEKKVVASEDKETFTPFFRCNVSTQDTGGTCKEITDADKAHQKYRANGTVTHTITGLKASTTYSVFVTSTMDSGKKVVSPTTNVMYVSTRTATALPTAATTITDDTTPKTFADGFDLSTGAPVRTAITASDYCIASTPGAAVDMYLDLNSSDKDPAIVGANGSRIADLGPIVKSDRTILTSALLESASRIRGTGLVPPVSDTATSATAPAATDVGQLAGYSRCGQSVLLTPYHLYSIAFLDNGAFRYALMETGSDITKPREFKIVVAKAGERKL